MGLLKLIGVGPNPLVLVAAETFTVVGTIDVASHRMTPTTTGAGAESVCGMSNNGGGNGGNMDGAGGGGAGGSFGTIGANGGTGRNGGNGGAALPIISSVTSLRGGCPGGGGGTGGGGGGAGASGAGGGAVYLIAGNTLTISGNIMSFALGATVGATAMVFILVANRAGFTAGLLGAVVFGSLLTALQGFLIGWVRANPIIVSIAAECSALNRKCGCSCILSACRCAVASCVSS